MIKKIIPIFLILIFSIIFISAEETTWGTYKQNSCVELSLVSDALSCNITSIRYPNSFVSSSDIIMTENLGEFNATFCNTNNLGIYTAKGICDGTPWVNDFQITPSGFSDTVPFFLIFIIIIIAIFIIGIILKNNWIMMLGSILVLIFGFFVIINGIDLIKDTNTTWAIGLVIWAIGLYGIYLSIEEQLKEWG